MQPTPTQLLIERTLGITRPSKIRVCASVADTTPDAQLLIKAQGVAAAVCHRINFPKVKAGKVSRKASLTGKMRPLLTEEETRDAAQTTIFALLSTGAYHRGTMTLADWKVVFRAVRGADCLRIDRKAKSGNEVLSIDSLTPEECDYLAARERLSALPLARRIVIARKVRYMRALCFAANRADTSRKARHSLRKNLAFVRFLSSSYAAQGAQGLAEITDGNDSSAHRQAARAFRKYQEKGEEVLTAESLALAPSKVERVLTSFSAIPENYAIAE